MSDDQQQSPYSESLPLYDRPRLTQPLAPPRQKGCSSRLESLVLRFLVLFFAVCMSLIGLGILIFWLYGEQLITFPRDWERLREQNETLQIQVATLQARTETLSTNELQIRDELQALAAELSSMSLVHTTLREQVVQVATIQAEANRERLAAAVMATAQTEREQQLARIDANLHELQGRIERITRFIQRLNDISGDTAFDLDVTPPYLTPTATPAEETSTSHLMLTPPATGAATVDSIRNTSMRTTPTPTRSATPLPMATRIYIVQPGDTILTIAEHFGVALNDLLDANNLTVKEAKLLIPEQQLIIP